MIGSEVIYCFAKQVRPELLADELDYVQVLAKSGPVLCISLNQLTSNSETFSNALTACIDLICYKNGSKKMQEAE